MKASSFISPTMLKNRRRLSPSSPPRCQRTDTASPLCLPLPCKQQHHKTNCSSAWWMTRRRAAWSHVVTVWCAGRCAYLAASTPTMAFRRRPGNLPCPPGETLANPRNASTPLSDLPQPHLFHCGLGCGPVVSRQGSWQPVGRTLPPKKARN
jgi:hypothetical protein